MIIVMKKILVNGAGRGHTNLVKTAKALGHEVIVTGMAGPCIPLADKTFPEVHPGHPEEVLEVAKKENVDGVIICCNDMGIQSVGRCNDVLHLSGITEQAAKYSSDKLAMKQRLVECGVRTAKFVIIHNVEELHDSMSTLQMPVIIKATDLQGSRGICIVKDLAILESSFSEVMSLTHKDYCIVEEFVEGTEFGAQAFVYNNEVLFVLPHGDETIMCKTAVPVGHYMPYEMDETLTTDVNLQATNAIKALGLNNCAVNIDFIERDGKAYIIELTGRGGANGLTDITGRYFGINYYEMILAATLGEDPCVVFAKKQDVPNSALSQMIKFGKSGIVKSISLPQINNVDITMFVGEGDEVREFTNCNDAIGEIFVKASSIDQCQKLVNEAINNISIQL